MEKLDDDSRLTQAPTPGPEWRRAGISMETRAPTRPQSPQRPRRPLSAALATRPHSNRPPACCGCAACPSTPRNRTWQLFLSPSPCERRWSASAQVREQMVLLCFLRLRCSAVQGAHAPEGARAKRAVAVLPTQSPAAREWHAPLFCSPPLGTTQF